ncbi:hypothetical protein [Streptomyces griseosporeus]|uniref:hypothetical protein n=1 Tax=Streptomyces griseosporeus TaxID=1910 RepID=UPI00167CE72E|nr:hypothetical protein [Streptomyces griseosporeus]
MKRALVGLSGPIGFDYANLSTVPLPNHSQGFQPNPILENTTGLLLCYDEVWFLTRDLCPVDMQSLPYVKFIEDDPALTQRCLVAANQYIEALNENDQPIPEAPRASSRLDEIMSAANFELIPDHHNRGTSLGGQYLGHSSWGVGNAFVDAGMALALADSLGSANGQPIDVVSNTVTSAFLSPDGSSPREKGGLLWWHRDAVEFLSPVRSITYLGPQGSYHESLEDLRSHPNIKEFRQFLATAEQPEGDGQRLAAEVSSLAEKHARDVLERYLVGRSKIFTAGSIAVGTIGNSIHPPLGSVASGSISALDWIRERKRRKSLSWSLFVLDLKRAHPNN